MLTDKRLQEIEARAEVAATLSDELHTVRLEYPEYLTLRESIDDIPAILAEIWRLREADRWIPVAERLPEKYKSVLVWMQHKSAGSSGYQVGVFANGCWFLPHGSDGSVGYPNNYAVTHWRPLPAPPNPPQ